MIFGFQLRSSFCQVAGKAQYLTLCEFSYPDLFSS
jgi:hypothetical protein